MEPRHHLVCVSPSRHQGLTLLQGADLHFGLGSHPLCVVQARMAYLSGRGNVPGPLFMLQDSCPLSSLLLTDWLRQIFASGCISGNFSSRSFRIGAAMVAAHNGVLDHLIQSLRQWSSNAYQLYIRTPAKALASLSQKLT